MNLSKFEMIMSKSLVVWIEKKIVIFEWICMKNLWTFMNNMIDKN